MQVNVQCQHAQPQESTTVLQTLTFAFANTSDQPFLMYFPFKICCAKNYKGIQRNCLLFNNVVK